MPNTPTYILYHGKATGKDKAGKTRRLSENEHWRLFEP